MDRGVWVTAGKVESDSLRVISVHKKVHRNFGDDVIVGVCLAIVD